MKYMIGIILGLIIGVPVGFNPIQNPFAVDSVPHSTVYVITAFGFIGGVLSGFFLLHKNTNPSAFLAKSLDKYIDYYSLFTVCMLSIGSPIILRVGFRDFYAGALVKGYFFSSVGLGLVLAGLGKRLLQHRTQLK